MHCYHCKQKVDLPDKKVSFRATCENCGRDLHVCKNCRFFSVGKPNDCTVPEVLPVVDKEKYNFCEDFKPQEIFLEKKEIDSDKLKRIFGEDIPSKKSFDDFFKD